jgi:GMP synthase-like glutamine amidotransferase
VHLTGSAAASAIFSGLPATFPALQWHSAEISQMPAGAECLATSPDCAVQAMSWGPRATSMQFHVEVEADTFRQWLAIPAYARALEKALGEGGAAVMEAACVAQLATFNAMAEQVYRNWLRTPAAD